MTAAFQSWSLSTFFQVKLLLSSVTLILSGPWSLLSSPDLASLHQGEVVARVLPPSDRAEVVTLSAVRVPAAPEAFRVCAADPSCLFGCHDLLAAGRLGVTPALEDLGGLDLDKSDREHLERCRVGRCRVRLSAEAITRFQQGVDWSEADALRRADALFRGMLADLAVRYVHAGDRGLGTYEDGGRRSAVAETLALLLSRPLPLLDLAPEMRTHLQAFPASALPAGGEYLAWRKERFWRQSLVSLEHVTVQTTSEGVVVAAAKQLYASHYFDGAMSVFALMPDPGGEGALLLHMSRARADIRPQGFTWLERVLLNRLVRGRLRRHLDALKASRAGARGSPVQGLRAPAAASSSFTFSGLRSVSP